MVRRVQREIMVFLFVVSRQTDFGLTMNTNPDRDDNDDDNDNGDGDG